MQQILHHINNAGLTAIEQGVNSVAAGSVARLSAINPVDFSLEIGTRAVVDLMLLHGDASSSTISINLSEGAVLRLTQLCVGNGSAALNITHEANAQSNIVVISLSNNNIELNMQLRGANGRSEVDTVQLGSNIDNNSLKLNMNHAVADNTSRSLSKCVAAGESTIAFDGLVYVATDAQRTLAEQNCRSIALSDTTHITARPQLEIYADDVKCSHGATMGQVDTDAILYMRQRGLSEAQARRVQIEGFVMDVADKCQFEDIREELKALIQRKLEEM